VEGYSYQRVYRAISTGGSISGKMQIILRKLLTGRFHQLSLGSLAELAESWMTLPESWRGHSIGDTTMRRTIFLAVLAAMFGQGAVRAQVINVYDSIGAPGGAIAGYADTNANNPIFGDSLNLAFGGVLQSVGFTIFNPGASAGPILTGTMTLSFYDNTVPYSSGSLAGQDPLLGTAAFSLSFGAGGLPAGFFSNITGNAAALNINLPPNIVVTQQFTETTGTANENGVILDHNSVVGSSPNTVYLNSPATSEGLYSFGGTAANSQFGYTITVPVPEPGSLALCGLVAASISAWRRRRAA
jgi:hypothetical protein